MDVLHQHELAVRRYERNCAVTIELAQLDALMESDICQLNTSAPENCRITKWNGGIK